jgi:hypothetical protein
MICLDIYTSAVKKTRENEFSVVCGLAPRWARSGPKTKPLGMPDKTTVSGVGLLRSPAQGKPAQHGVMSQPFR